jgi:hypothetical protein
MLGKKKMGQELYPACVPLRIGEYGIDDTDLPRRGRRFYGTVGKEDIIYPVIYFLKAGRFVIVRKNGRIYGHFSV